MWVVSRFFVYFSGELQVFVCIHNGPFRSARVYWLCDGSVRGGYACSVGSATVGIFLTHLEDFTCAAGVSGLFCFRLHIAIRPPLLLLCCSHSYSAYLTAFHCTHGLGCRVAWG